MSRRRCACGNSLPAKCLPFCHDYTVKGEAGHGHRTVRCDRCGYEKIQQHFGRGVWL